MLQVQMILTKIYRKDLELQNRQFDGVFILP